MKNVPVFLKLKTIEPVPVPYWKTVFEPVEIAVIVEVPCTKELVFNYDSFLDNKDKSPILTLKGYQYVIDEINKLQYPEQHYDDSEFDNEF